MRTFSHALSEVLSNLSTLIQVLSNLSTIFDKSLPRKVREKNYTNSVMLVPSNEFVAALPYGKIPDREDFTKMESEQRITYWRKVLVETERLAESFDNTINHVDGAQILPIDSI